MEALEQVTVLMTIMRQLGQVMEHECRILRTMQLEGLNDLQAEKVALAEAYEIELRHLRQTPETLASLEPEIRRELEAATREFQTAVGRNAQALAATKTVVERLCRSISESLAASGPSRAQYGGKPSEQPSAKIIPLAFDRNC